MWKFGRKIFYSIIIQFAYFILLFLEGYAMESKSIFYLPADITPLFAYVHAQPARYRPLYSRLTRSLYIYSWREMISLFITIARNSAKNKSIYFIVYIIDCKAIIISINKIVVISFLNHNSIFNDPAII